MIRSEYYLFRNGGYFSSILEFYARPDCINTQPGDSSNGIV